MDSINKPRSATGVNVYSIFCDFHGLPASRKGALEAEVRGQHRFICAPCCDRAGAARYEDVYGHPDLAPVDWIFSASEEYPA